MGWQRTETDQDGSCGSFWGISCIRGIKVNLISTEHGQSLQLFVAEEERPRSGLYLPDLIRKISERYAFAIAPTNYETVMKEGDKYKEGCSVTERRTITIKAIGFFVDGILAVTWNTDVADGALN